MKWITRERPKIDRIACPWLIERFIDPSAEFIFAPPADVLRLAASSGSMEKSSSRTSQKTGVAPQWTTVLALATIVKVGMITSSPGPIPRARRTASRPAVALDTARAPLPIYSKFDSLSETPALLNSPPIEYPGDLKAHCVQGRVVVQMIIDTLGRPERESIQYMRLPHVGFKLPVSRYLAFARFRPARRGGRPVRSIVYFPVTFMLRSCPGFPTR